MEREEETGLRKLKECKRNGREIVGREGKRRTGQGEVKDGDVYKIKE